VADEEAGFWSQFPPLKPSALRDALATIPDEFGLQKNDVGNLVIVAADLTYVGYINLRTAEVVWLRDEEEPT
jgi:hypothetical protein